MAKIGREDRPMRLRFLRMFIAVLGLGVLLTRGAKGSAGLDAPPG